MPLYAYKCANGHQFDVRQRFADDPLETCTICDAEARRVIGNVGVVFKGSGFYITDSRNGKSSAALNGNGRREGGSDASDDKKSTSDESASTTPSSSASKDSGGANTTTA